MPWQIDCSDGNGDAISLIPLDRKDYLQISYWMAESAFTSLTGTCPPVGEHFARMFLHLIRCAGSWHCLRLSGSSLWAILPRSWMCHTFQCPTHSLSSNSTASSFCECSVRWHWNSWSESASVVCEDWRLLAFIAVSELGARENSFAYTWFSVLKVVKADWQFDLANHSLCNSVNVSGETSPSQPWLNYHVNLWI